jgi:ribosomal protein S11
MKRLIKIKSNIKYIKRIFKCKSYGPQHLKLKSAFLKTRLSLIIFIRVLSNNVFFCLFDRRQKKTLLTASSGALKIKITKKRIKHHLGLLIDSFFNKIKRFVFRKNLILNITSPKMFKSKIVEGVTKILKQRNIILIFNPSKIFNGCRSKKSRRKKQKGLVLYH